MEIKIHRFDCDYCPVSAEAGRKKHYPDNWGSFLVIPSEEGKAVKRKHACPDCYARVEKAFLEIK